MDGSEALRERSVHYPVADGKPMAESDAHRREMTDYVLEVLEDFFADDPDVYVSGNNFLYYRKGDPKGAVSPDAYVVRGVPKGLRDTFKRWEEGGRGPCFVLELTSKSTHDEDQGRKLERYRDALRVPEYVLFDLRGDWIPELLRGFVLRDGRYRPVPLDGDGRWPSRELGLELGVVDGHLRFFPPGSDEPLPTRRERAEEERTRAEEERTRAEEERTRAEEERTRAEEAEAELRRLRARLGEGPGSED